MASTAAKDPALAKNAIGLRVVLSQSVTHMAPAAAVAFPYRLERLTWRAPTACGGVGADRMLVRGGVHRRAGQAPTVGGRLLHVYLQGPPSLGRLPRGVGLCRRRGSHRVLLVPELLLRSRGRSELGVRLDQGHLVDLGRGHRVDRLGAWLLRGSRLDQGGHIMGAFEIVVFGRSPSGSS